ncbi:MAG: Bpu10I family restriction endonuclease [Cyanobacteria bacterium J06621_11]
MLPTPHLDKINAAISNAKTPDAVVARLKASLARYAQWISDMTAVKGTRDEVVVQLVQLFNDYKFYIDFTLIFSCKEDFLYRQKGQLKLDNTVIEEFLPHLAAKSLPALQGVNFGPTKCFSSVYFKTSLQAVTKGGGLSIRTKDQDFAISKRLYIQSSHSATFDQIDSVTAYLSYVTAECKTNLDKTMFQEATATANDIKSALPGAKYFLMCEWLDMTPISTAPTDIDEVLLLRRAKRIPSNTRKSFSTYSGRLEKADWYRNFLHSHPFDPEVFLRFIGHIEKLLDDEDPAENTVLEDGYF